MKDILLLWVTVIVEYILLLAAVITIVKIFFAFYAKGGLGKRTKSKHKDLGMPV